MKFRTVFASDVGPQFIDHRSLEELAVWLLRCGRAGAIYASESMWKTVRGKWVPIVGWDMGMTA